VIRHGHSKGDARLGVPLAVSKTSIHLITLDAPLFLSGGANVLRATFQRLDVPQFGGNIVCLANRLLLIGSTFCQVGSQIFERQGQISSLLGNIYSFPQTLLQEQGPYLRATNVCPFRRVLDLLPSLRG
jgi:hypothetical protein